MNCSTLKTSVYHGCIVCSDKQDLKSEFKYLQNVFHTFNAYPHWIIKKSYKLVKSKMNFTNEMCQLHQIWDKVFKNKPSKKFFKGCLPQILLGPFLNTLSHIAVNDSEMLPSENKSVLLYTSRESCTMIKSWRKDLQRMLTPNIKTQLIYK